MRGRADFATMQKVAVQTGSNAGRQNATREKIMKCEICKKNEASVHFKQVVDGVAREVYVCAECAAKNGLDVQSPPMHDFLFGIGVQGEAAKTNSENRVCPSCRLSQAEFQKRSRLGCPRCYEAFSEELEHVLAAMHKGPTHKGKVPASEEASAEIAALQGRLQEAVAAQHFEEAARLRDEIKGIKERQAAANPLER